MSRQEGREEELRADVIKLGSVRVGDRSGRVTNISVVTHSDTVVLTAELTRTDLIGRWSVMSERQRPDVDSGLMFVCVCMLS